VGVGQLAKDPSTSLCVPAAAPMVNCDFPRAPYRSATCHAIDHQARLVAASRVASQYRPSSSASDGKDTAIVLHLSMSNSNMVTYTTAVDNITPDQTYIPRLVARL